VFEKQSTIGKHSFAVDKYSTLDHVHILFQTIKAAWTVLSVCNMIKTDLYRHFGDWESAQLKFTMDIINKSKHCHACEIHKK